MLDPQAECPDCGARLGGSMDCRSCGWKPTPPRVEPVRKAVPEWTPPPFTPPSPEEAAAVRKLIAETSAKLGAAAPQARPRAIETVKRCPNCVNGKFKHLGVVFCLECYRRLPGA